MEYDTKTDRRKLLGISMRVILALVLVGLLVAPIAVQADLKATATPYAWDFDRHDFRNSRVRIPWDGTWVPFLERLPFDAQIYTGVIDPDPDNPGDEYYVCDYDPVNETGGTAWAGLMVYGLYHEDIPDVAGEVGATGFSQSRHWSLVNCDRNNDNVFNDADLSVPGPYMVEEPDDPSDPDRPWPPVDDPRFLDDCEEPGGWCQVIGPADAKEECDAQGGCTYEIVTTLLINLDLDCGDPDGLDAGIPLDRFGNPMVCFYAEGRTPTPEQQAWSNYMWTQPLQARIGPVGGAKTVSFELYSITAVELAAFDAAAQDDGVMLTWETATELDNLGFNIYRADSQVGEMNKINPSLIPSKDPGSTVGATYSFLDESAVPGATYYYWLEDMDVSGAAEMNGPVTAKMGSARALPGRPRPAPMPANAF